MLKKIFDWLGSRLSSNKAATVEPPKVEPHPARHDVVQEKAALPADEKKKTVRKPRKAKVPSEEAKPPRPRGRPPRKKANV